MSTTGRSGSRRRTSLSNSRPLRSGKLTSSSNKSNGCSPSLPRPDSPVSALDTPYPSLVNSSYNPSRISDSSSTTRIAPLDMNRFPHGWKLDVKRRAFPWRRAYIYFSCVLLDDSVAHGKPQARASTTGLGCEKRIENPVNVLAWNPCSGIHYFYFHAPVVRAGAHFQHAARGHGIARIQEKIKEDFLHFVGGSPHRPQAFAQIFYHLDLRRFQRVRYQRQRFFHYLIHIDVRDFG